MPQNDRNRSSNRTAPKARPWNLLLIREYSLKGDDPNADPRTDWLRVGHAFKNEKGFSIEPYVDIRRGDRLVILPPTDDQDPQR